MNNCITCGKPAKRIWCSQKCNAITRKKGKYNICNHCGKSFYLRQSEIYKGSGRFCSMDCRKNYFLINRTGYIKIKGRYAHRIAMELAIGRELLPSEVVHHIDGNKRNNDISNLILFKTNSEHLIAEKRTIPHDVAVANGKRSVEARRSKKAHSSALL